MEQDEVTSQTKSCNSAIVFCSFFMMAWYAIAQYYSHLLAWLVLRCRENEDMLRVSGASIRPTSLRQ